MSADRPPGSGPLDEVTCVRGESFVVSDPGGDIVRGGDHGFYVRDTRFLDLFELEINDQPARPLSAAMRGTSGAVFHGYVPIPGAGADPVLIVERRRWLTPALREEIRLCNRGRGALDVEVRLRFGSDLAYIFDVRHQRSLPPVDPSATDSGVRFVRADGVDHVTIAMEPRPDRWEAGALVRACHLDPGETRRLAVSMVATDVYGTVGAGQAPENHGHPPQPARGHTPAWSLTCADHRLQRLVQRSVDDLQALRMADPDGPGDDFCAAGSPWYLTLFGRDALWTAFMALPFDLDLARGTLRVLARRQGQTDDPGTEEAPGKILHEIRRGSLTHRGDLPPNYYGTIDATPLFVILAHEAWRFGLPEPELRALLPHLRTALDWLRATVAQHEDGYLSYRRSHPRGLDNQGWKDSHDGVQFADGTLASPPIALAEVQGYAHDAAVRGAALLRALAQPGAAEWEVWAADLAARFREEFWLEDAEGRYPAIALDGGGQRVDGPASNMGHLLATGLIDDAEVAAIASRLVRPELSSGWGLRTLSTDCRGFNPLGYHTGSVWPHDTAIAVWGLASRGQRDVAVQLLRGLVHAAPTFEYRLPELFGGFGHDDAPTPVPYPSACRPQAWAAGAALLVLRACLGLYPDLPNGRLRIRPLWPPPFRSLEVRGLPMGTDRLDLRIDRDRGVDAHLAAGSLAVEVVQPTS